MLAILAVSSLLLAARGQLPAAPVFVLVIVAIGAGLWWLADRGGRYRDRPVAGPLEALMLVAATLGSIVVFWLLWDVLG